MSAPVLDVRGLVKDYQSLRPLRIRELVVPPGDILSLGGLDAQAAEIFVHLVTGAALPDEGDILLFGRNTREVPDLQAWLQSLDGLGLVSGRAVLVDMLTVLQNVAMPLTLDIDPIDAAILPAVQDTARDAGLDPGVWDLPLGASSPEVQARVRFARAIAARPTLVIAEHPSVGLSRDAVARVAEDFSRVSRARGAALVVVTVDPEFTRAMGGRQLTLKAATGEVAATSGLVGRFKRVLGRS